MSTDLVGVCTSEGEECTGGEGGVWAEHVCRGVSLGLGVCEGCEGGGVCVGSVWYP